jgi:hypothetical protein
MGNAYYSCDSHSPFIERIIGVAASVESVKRGTIIRIQRQPEPDALWQVGIREEIPSKGHQISIALFNGSLGSVRFKTPSRDNPSREYLSQPRGRNVPLAFGDQHVPFVVPPILLIPFFADPVAYVRRAIKERYPLCFTSPEKANNLDIN